MEPKIISGAMENVSIEAIREHPNNPNRNELPPIIDSIEKVGFYGAIQVQRSTGYIIAGNHRYKAAIAAGLTEVPVIYLDVDDDEATRLMLNDNRTAENGKQDQEQVEALLAEWREGDLSFGKIDSDINVGGGVGLGDDDEDEDEEDDKIEPERQGKPDTSKDPSEARRIISLTYNADDHAVAQAGIALLRERHEASTNGEAVLAHLREALK